MAVSSENERLKKLKTNKSRTATTTTVSTSDPATHLKQKGVEIEASREDKIMATLQAVQSEMATLREKMEMQSLNSSKTNNEGKRSKRACRKCTDENKVDHCDLCFYCGNSEHWSKGCCKRGNGRMPASGNQRRLQLKDKE